MKRALLAAFASALVWLGNAPVVNAAPSDSVILVIDASRSMQGKRLDVAQAIGKEFLQDLPDGVKAGLVTFNSEEVNTVALTSDISQVLEALASINAQGNTALYDGVIKAIDLAKKPQLTRLVVLTDGYDTASSFTATEVEQAVADAGITIDVVAIAATDANLKVMKSFTDAGNGRVFQADEIAQLESVLARALTQAAPIPIESMASKPSALPEPTIDVQPAPEKSSVSKSIAMVVTGPVGIVVALLVLFGYSFIAIRHLLAKRRKSAMYKSLDIYDPRISRFGKNASDKLDPFIDVAQPSLTRNAATTTMVSMSSRAFPNLALRIERADMQVTPERWVTLFLFGFIGLFLLFQALTGAWLLAVLVSLGIVYSAQNAILKSRAAQHLRKFEAGLADFLVLIASGLRAGMSFAQSVESAAAEGSGPVERQMRRALGEVRVGSTLEGALGRVAERMHSDDLRWSIAALQIQREVGGNLSKILDTAAATIRNRAELKREVQALSAEGQLSAYVLLALPISVFLFLGITRPDYVAIFWTQRIGMVMLGLFTVLVASGWLWIKNIVAIEV